MGLKLKRGQQFRVDGFFRDGDGKAADPSSVVLHLKRPDGSTTVYTYGDGADVVRKSAGRFYVLVIADQPGQWFWEWTVSGGVTGADYDSFEVLPSPFQDA